MRIVASIVAVLAFAACAQVSEFRGPSGRTAYSIDCGGTRSACLSKAGELCPDGYNVIDQTTGTMILPVAGGGAIGGPQHTIAIECKKDG